MSIFEVTPEQALELQRLQTIVTEKRKLFLEIEKKLKDMKTQDDESLLKSFKQAENELKEASFNFNSFTYSLPLARKTGT